MIPSSRTGGGGLGARDSSDDTLSTENTSSRLEAAVLDNASADISSRDARESSADIAVARTDCNILDADSLIMPGVYRRPTGLTAGPLAGSRCEGTSACNAGGLATEAGAASVGFGRGPELLLCVAVGKAVDGAWSSSDMLDSAIDPSLPYSELEAPTK